MKIGMNTVPYPEVFWGGWFFNECSKEKKHIAAGGSGGGGQGGTVSPPQWGPGAKPQKSLTI